MDVIGRIVCRRLLRFDFGAYSFTHPKGFNYDFECGESSEAKAIWHLWDQQMTEAVMSGPGGALVRD